MPQRRHRELITAPRIAEQMSPSPRFVTTSTASPRHSRPRPRDHRNPIPFPECRCEPGFPVSPHCDHRRWPNLLHQSFQSLPILRIRAPGQESAHMRRLARQHTKQRQQIAIGNQSQVRCRQRALAQLPALRIQQRPLCFRATPSIPSTNFGEPTGRGSTFIYWIFACPRKLESKLANLYMPGTQAPKSGISGKSHFANFAHLRETFPHADQVGKFTVFNIGGNKARLIAALHYNRNKAFIRHVLTHKEYDAAKWKE